MNRLFPRACPCLRSPLAALALLLLACLTTLAGGATAKTAERPNFVIIIADDMAWDDCGAYGNSKIRTPNLDRLAREGMRFDRAFLMTSSCSPSRASILTGRYPHATGAPELHQPLPASQVMLSEPLREAGYYTASAGKWHLGGPAKSKWDLVREGGGPSGCEHWLPVLRERPKEKPFFLWLAAVDPHRQYQPGAISRPHSPEEVVVPPYLPDTESVRRDLALYYDEIARMDGFIGQVLDELEKQDLAKNTFVLFLTDNGRPFPRCKTTLYDDGIRTPFLVRFPGRVKPGSQSDSLVSAVDIAPTVLDLAGIKAAPTFHGRSFARLLENPKATVREYAFAEHNWHDYRAFERGARSRRFTYIRNWLPELPGTPPADAVTSPTYAVLRELRDQGNLPPQQRSIFVTPRPAEELYDLEADPHSFKNLAGDPKYSGVLDKHRKALDHWREETGDTFDRERLTPDGFDRETGARKLPRGKARPE